MKPETKIAEGIRQRHHLDGAADVRVIATKFAAGKDLGGDPHKFTARITTDALDRQDEVVLPEGGQFGEFLSSGAIFWNHQYDNPVGFPDKGKKIIRGENFVEAGGIFMQRPAGYQGEFFPDFVREFVTQGMSAGINPGVSIGFQPLETRRPSKADATKYGEKVQLVHTRWKLLEFSIAPVQANQEAVVTAVGKGLIRREVAKAVGFAVPEVVTFTPPAPRKVIQCGMFLPADPKPVDMAALVEREMTRAVYKKYGRMFM